MNLHKNSVILALDLPDFKAAKNMVEKTQDEIGFYKIGLEMMMSGDYFKMIEFLKSKNKKIFADLKLYDIPQTIARAVANLAQYDIDFLTIHSANYEIMSAAVQNKGKMQILAVTVLTSLEKNDLSEMGFDEKYSLEELVVKKAALSMRAGVDGVVASANEAKKLREKLGEKFIIVTPGIRLEANNDDQKRVADVKTALQNKSNYLVVGRPITQAVDPAIAAKNFNKIIAEIDRNSK